MAYEADARRLVCLFRPDDLSDEELEAIAQRILDRVGEDAPADDGSAR